MNDATAQPRTDPAPVEPPLGAFGKYRLVKKLAAGGMAQIYLATIDGPQGFSKTCVIKRILPQFANMDDFSEMFVTEAKVAALLSHPNIVQVFDFGSIDSQYYLAMEWIDGTSLNGLMRAAAKAKVPLGPELAVHLGIPLCDALSYVGAMRMPNGEALNLVHRDVTPGNVLISNTAEVKLTDFGVVKTSVNAKSTSAGVLKGKFAYMSPEQVRHQVLDHRSDLFSLGVVLFEVATGQRLFKRATIADMLAAVGNADIPMPTEICPGFPEEVERILLKALEREPEDRYQSAREMMADLDAYRIAQQLPSGRRELSSLMATLFPDSVSASSFEPSYPGSKPSTSKGKRMVPLRGPQESAHPGTARLGVAAAKAGADDEEDSLPGVSIEIEEEGRPSLWSASAAIAAAVSATAGFWWWVLN